jgi:hypothetical protein
VTLEICPFCGASHPEGSLLPVLLERKRLDVTGLEPDAVRVVERIVERLRLGQERYGKLDIATNRRDAKAWRREAAEEYLDGAVYACIAALAEEQGR